MRLWLTAGSIKWPTRELLRKYGLHIGPDGISLEGSDEQIARAIDDAFQQDDLELAKFIFRGTSC